MAVKIDTCGDKYIVWIDDQPKPQICDNLEQVILILQNKGV